jgi:biopolymer transport protein ExbD
MPPIKEGGVNVTPLIDVVMCLIIFFMLVARIGVDTGGDRDVTVPASFLGVDLKDMGNALTLNVTNGPTLVNGDAQPLITCMLNGKRQEIKVRSDNGGSGAGGASAGSGFPLYDTLKRFKEGDPRYNLAPNPGFKVIIRADENTEYQYIQPVLAECSRAGVSYDFATQKGETLPQ